MYDPLGILNDTKPKKGQPQSDPLGILKKKESGGVSGTTISSNGSGLPSKENIEDIRSFVTGESPEQRQQRQQQELKQKATQQLPSQKNINEEAVTRLQHPSIQEHLEQSKRMTGLSDLNDDPIGSFIGKNETEKKAIKDTGGGSLDSHKEIAVRDRQNDLVKNNFFSDGYDAEEYLKGKQVNPNNLTHQIAIQKVQQKQKVDDAINTTTDIAKAANKFYTGQENEMQGDISNSKEGQHVLDFLNDPNVMARANHDPDFRQKYKEEQFNFYNHYPDKAKEIVNTKIAQELEDKGHINWLYNNPGKEKVDPVVDDMVKSGKLNAQEKNVYDNERQHLGTLKSLIFGSPIPTADVVNAYSKGLEQGTTGMLSSARDISNKVTGGAFQKLGLLESDADRTKRLQEETYSTPTVQGKGLHGMLSGAAGFAGFATPMILGSMAGSPPEATAVMQFEGGNADRARELFKDKGRQDLYTILGTTIDAALMKALPTKAAGETIKGLFKNELVGTINNLADKKITESAAKELWANKIKDFIGSTVKGNTQTAAIVDAFNLAHNGLDAAFGKRDFNLENQAKEAIKNYPSLWLNSTFLSAIAAGGSNEKSVNGATIRSLADSPEQARLQIEEMAKQHPELKDLRQQSLDNLDHAVKINEELKGRDLSEAQKNKFMMLSLKDKILNEKAKAIPDKTLRADTEKELALNQIDKERTLNPDMGNKKFIEEMYNEELLPKGHMILLEDEKGKFSEPKVGEYLKFIAQQSNSLGEDWKPLEGKPPSMNKVPEQVIEAANERWSKEIGAAKQPIAETTPTEERKTTPQSENIVPQKEFQTMNMGNDEGKDETKEARKVMKERFSDGDIKMDGEDGKGETGKEFASRILNQWEKTKTDEPNNTTVVTHSSVLKAIKAYENMKDKPEDVNNFSPEQWKEFSDNYNKESTDNGDLETFKGTNGDIHVIRHGQTEDNAANKFRSGNTNLTEKGVEQTAESGKELKEKTGGEVPKIISSDLPRAIHSSNIINEELGKPRIRVSAEQLQASQPGYNKDFEDFKSNILDHVANVKDNSFDFRITTGLKTQKEIEQAVRNIKEGKDTKASKTLLAGIKRMYDEGYVELNTSAGGLSQRIGVPIKEYMAEVNKPLKIEDLDHLNTLLGEDAFNSNFDNAYYYETQRTGTGEQTSEVAERATGKNIEETSGGKSPPPTHTEIQQEGGEGKPPINPPNVLNSGSNSESPEGTKIANAVNDAFVEKKFGTQALDQVVSKLEDADFDKVYNNVKAKIENGTIDTKNVRERVITTKGGTSADQAALLYDMVQLKNKERNLMQEIISESDDKIKDELQKQLTSVQNDMMDNALANRVMGRDWYHIGEIRQQWAKDDFSLDRMAEQYKASKGLSELTPEQDKEIKAAYNKIRELEAKRNAARAEADKAIEENAKLILENEKLKQLGDQAKRQKKADRGKKSDEAIAKSNARIQAEKNELKKLRGNLSAGFDPRVAARLSKIAAEKVYQGIIKFDELVKNVWDTVKDVLTDYTEQDIRNHLLPNAEKEVAKYYKTKEGVTFSNKELREKVKAWQDLQKEYALKIFEWQKDRRMDIMAKRPLKDRLIDYTLRWQRFAILSYPTTIVKLAAVVGHQLAFKPLKFAIQKGISLLTPESIKSKQSIWGNPSLSSLGKYYSALIRNFSLANLKEQFAGIDTKEILYGKGNIYDEWAAAKGLLEMPGRSHGYIKSFIKNPEFQFAHEQQITHAISQIADIEQKLKNPNLKEADKKELQDEYEIYDITKSEVMERINKLSLEHGKWGILMNDNKFVKKFQNWADKKDLTSALVRSELPIVKIPTNYVSRAFATKFGLIKALTGTKWMGGNTPSIMSLIFKGTEQLTSEQAELLGKSLNLGTMGAAFFGLGYMLAPQIKENDDGSVDIFGIHFSRNVVHSPELESFFAGATTKNEKDKGKSFIRGFIDSDIDIAKKSPFVSMLKYGFIPNVASALLETKNKEKITDKISDAVARKITDMTIPGFVKQPAQWLDTNESGFHPMKNTIKRTPQGDDLERFWQTFELAIPGLRENVPESKSSSSRKSGKSHKATKSTE